MSPAKAAVPQRDGLVEEGGSSRAPDGSPPAQGQRFVSGKLIVIVAFLASMAATGFALATRGTLAHNLAPPKAHGSHPAAQPALYGDATWPKGAHPAPPIRLADQSGKIFNLASQRGKVVVVTFMDSKCTTLCPLEAAGLAQVRAALPPAAAVELVVVSTDPSGDTPASEAAFAKRFGWGGWNWHWLNAPRQTLQQVWSSYGVKVDSANAHTSLAFVLGRRGNERVALQAPFIPQIMTSDIKALGG